MIMDEWIIPILMAAIGSISFGMFFGVISKKLVFSALGGALTWGVYLVAMHFNVSEPICYALAAASGTFFAEILARIVKTPVTVFIITSIIPLVPGGALYYTMLGLLQGNQEVFLTKGSYTLSAAGAMALGMFAATMLFKIILGFLTFSKSKACD
ncbi:MAG: threonine/serine exporter family protein [Clostridia bacterium]|nr:threonine/serine exporter family protein [Clostridia bacterium]